ncbi:hypothetical protein PG996_005252 [Apiospora saccharicola]|uniref:Uncharacterized protein n=1 Tax=Apiospora saccharicola TaxID=335842 RepID=A0ABR1VKY1_9PEZI
MELSFVQPQSTISVLQPITGTINNIIVTTLPVGQEYGTGSAAALESQVKNLSRTPPRDIRLGDVLVALPEGERAVVAYKPGKETTEDGFQPLHLGYVLAITETVIRSVIGSIKLYTPNDAPLF